MTWDWDKLQEKRNKNQNARKVPPPPDPSEEGEDVEAGRKEPRNHRYLLHDGGNGSGQGPFQRLAKMKRPKNSLILGVLAAGVVIWLLTGIYIINPDEQGIVLRFGKYNRTEGPGPHYALPEPIEKVYKPQVTQVLRSEVGFRSVGQSSTFQQGQVRTIAEEASMLTGDENIVNVQFSVQYKIGDPVKYLFNITSPTALVRSAAEAAMREVIGNSEIDSAITDGKLKIQNEATTLLQDILDRYGAGIQVLAVQLQDVHPPKEVIDAFKDVASAMSSCRAQEDRLRHCATRQRPTALPVCAMQKARLPALMPYARNTTRRQR